MNIKLLADRVLILPATVEKKIGGIIIPDSAKEKPLYGTVIAVGYGTKNEKMILKEGDEVLYGKYSGTELEYEGKKYLVMQQSDIIAIVHARNQHCLSATIFCTLISLVQSLKKFARDICVGCKPEDGR